MNTPASPSPPAQGRSRGLSPRRQRGISLMVSLVLLVVVTLIALGSMRGVTMQTRMSGAAHDRNLNFQAAEAALREAEARAAAAVEADIPASGCSNGICAKPALADTPRWTNSAFTDWRASAASAPTDASPAEAIVEDMGSAPNWLGCDSQIPPLPNCITKRYLVSARSTAEGRANVAVQSQFAAP